MVLRSLPRSTSRNQLSLINLGWVSKFWPRIVIKSNGDECEIISSVFEKVPSEV